jgi:hypothetical protein
VGVGEDFQTFCGNLTVPDRSAIATRYGLITRRVNIEFWDTDNSVSHSFYAGSFGRGTATGATSDVDMLVVLPGSIYSQYYNHVGNGPSALLQAVRNALRKTYPSTNLGADGQVVVVNFSTGAMFEVLPAFSASEGKYLFPDSSEGGKWRLTDPKPEIAAMDQRDSECNGNLKRLCRMARAWKQEWTVPISGLLIDTLAYQFIVNWEWRTNSYLYYDWMSRDFFQFLLDQPSDKRYWLSPGAGQYVWRGGNFEYKATRCRNLAKEAIDYYRNDMPYSARKKWREIYGSSFPS